MRCRFFFMRRSVMWEPQPGTEALKTFSAWILFDSVVVIIVMTYGRNI